MKLGDRNGTSMMDSIRGRYFKLLVAFAAIITSLGTGKGAEWWVATNATPDGQGTEDSPWDLQWTLAGREEIEPDGSSRAYVDNYLVEGNICYDGGSFLIGGGRPSRNIRVLENYLCGTNMRIGYSAPYNEDCEIRDNVIVNGRLEIKDYRKVVNQGNLVLGPNDRRPTEPDVRIVLRRNRYDPNRANLAVFNWAKKPTIELPLEPFLATGDTYRLMDPRDFFGKPISEGTYRGGPIRVSIEGEFAAFVLLKAPSKP